MNNEQIGDVLVVTLPARLDATGVAEIESQLSQTLLAHKGKTLIDMGQVTFVASLALRMLLTNLRTLQEAGGDLRLSNLQPQIAEVFRKSRFDTMFKIYSDNESGLAAYN